MRISTKGRYGLAAMLTIANASKPLSALEISESLALSKIYLEQVFSMLKKAQLVESNKGSLGGYFLPRPLEEITVLEILQATELALFEPTGSNGSTVAKALEVTLEDKVYSKIDKCLKETLGAITLKELVNRPAENMFYI